MPKTRGPSSSPGPHPTTGTVGPVLRDGRWLRCPECRETLLFQPGCGRPWRFFLSFAAASARGGLVLLVPAGLLGGPRPLLLVLLGLGAIEVVWFKQSGLRFAVDGVLACPRCGLTAVGGRIGEADGRRRRSSLLFFTELWLLPGVAALFYLLMWVEDCLTGGAPAFGMLSYALVLGWLAYLGLLGRQVFYLERELGIEVRALACQPAVRVFGSRPTPAVLAAVDALAARFA